MTREEIEKYITENIRVREKMGNFEALLKYKFKDRSWLAKAMCSIKVTTKNGKSTNEFYNDPMATVGDAIIKAILAVFLFKDKNIKDSGLITIEKSQIEDNQTFHDIMMKKKWIKFAFNEKHFHNDKSIPEHEKVRDDEHDPYIEAIVAAIYFDSNYDKTKKWVIKYLLPILEEYK